MPPDLCNLPALVVATQNENTAGVADLTNKKSKSIIAKGRKSKGKHGVL